MCGAGRRTDCPPCLLSEVLLPHRPCCRRGSFGRWRERYQIAPPHNAPVVAMAGLPIALPKVGARIVLNEPGMSLLGTSEALVC
jgi:hypothetical protein